MRYLQSIHELTEKLSQETLLYIEKGIEEILDKEGIKGKTKDKYKESLFFVWLNLEYREYSLSEIKRKAYISAWYKNEDIKEIKAKHKDKRGQILFPFNKDRLLEIKHKFQLQSGHSIISNAVELLIKYAIVDPVWGSNYLDEKGEIKELLIATPDNQYREKSEYYKEVHSSKGYMTKLLYRPHSTHLLNGNDIYEDILGGEYVNIHSKDLNGKETKTKIPTRTFNAKKVSYINEQSRLIRTSYKNSPVVYSSIFVNDTHHGGRLYSNIQNIPSKQRDNFLLQSGFDDKYDVVSAKFKVYLNLAGQSLDYDPYIRLGERMGFSLEWSTQHREALKACSQVMLESGNLNYYQKIKALSYALAQRGLIISSTKYGDNQSNQWKGILNKEELIHSINTGDTWNYTQSIKQKVQSKFNAITDNRLTSGKMRSFVNKKMNKEDFAFDENNTYIINRSKKGSIESITVFYKNGEMDEIFSDAIANQVMQSQAITTALNISSYRKKHSITCKYQEVNAHLFYDTFIKEYNCIMPFIQSNMIDYTYIESNLTLDIMVNLFEKNIQTINIHDGYYCKKEDKEKVEEIVTYFYSKEVFNIVKRLLDNLSKKRENKRKKLKKPERENYSYKGQYRLDGLIEVDGFLIDANGEIVESPPDKRERVA